jgi:hypothetical protein
MVEVLLSSNTIRNWRNHRLSSDCAGWEVEMGSRGAMLRRTHRRRMCTKCLSHLISRGRGECNGKGCLERTPDKIVYLNGAAQRNPMSQKGSRYLDHLSCAPSPRENT